MSTYMPPDAEGYSAFETTEDDDGDFVEAERTPSGFLTVGHSGFAGAGVSDDDQRALAAFILGWPVDEVTRVDPATHVVVEKADARWAAEASALRGMPASDARAARLDAVLGLRAALGEDGAR